MDRWNYNISRIGGLVFYALATCCLFGILCNAYHHICTMFICVVMGRVLFADAKKIKQESETYYKGKL